MCKLVDARSIHGALVILLIRKSLLYRYDIVCFLAMFASLKIVNAVSCMAFCIGTCCSFSVLKQDTQDASCIMQKL